MTTDYTLQLSKVTPTMRKIAGRLLSHDAAHPSDEVIELTQEEIARDVGVSTRSVIRALSEMRHAVSQTQRGRLRIADLAALNDIALRSQTAPVPQAAVAPSPCVDPQPHPTLAAPVSVDIADLQRKVEYLYWKIPGLEVDIARALARRGRSVTPPRTLLLRWVKRQCLSELDAALRLELSHQQLQSYLNGTSPPLSHREIIRTRTGISPHAWDNELPIASQPPLPLLDSDSSKAPLSKRARAKPRAKPPSASPRARRAS